ncbi:hypothetical protein [Agaribacterium sp. ZY112]|uniref:hypothetical protein n=1 Tax=Agaribacterium sp. ZY112 TaxID=3233574 RepID=UPI003524B9CB
MLKHLNRNYLKQNSDLAEIQLNPIDFACKTLSENKILGLGEAHWYPSIFSSICDIIFDERVLNTCTDIVVEMGNIKHQAMLDSYIEFTDHIYKGDIREVLLDSIIFPVWLAPQYINFLKSVRDINLRRKREKKTLIRIHLTEDEFSWKKIKSKADYIKQNSRRDEALFSIIKNRFIDENKPTIVLAGARHLLKKSPKFTAKNVRQLCDDYQQNRFVSVWPHFHLTDHSIADGWSPPTIISLALNGKLSECRFTDISYGGSKIKQMPFKQPLHELIEGYLYLGDVERDFTFDAQYWADLAPSYIEQARAYLNPRQITLIEPLISSFKQISNT